MNEAWMMVWCVWGLVGVGLVVGWKVFGWLCPAERPGDHRGW